MATVTFEDLNQVNFSGKINSIIGGKGGLIFGDFSTRLLYIIHINPSSSQNNDYPSKLKVGKYTLSFKEDEAYIGHSPISLRRMKSASFIDEKYRTGEDSQGNLTITSTDEQEIVNTFSATPFSPTSKKVTISDGEFLVSLGQ